MFSEWGGEGVEGGGEGRSFKFSDLDVERRSFKGQGLAHSSRREKPNLEVWPREGKEGILPRLMLIRRL